MPNAGGASEVRGMQRIFGAVFVFVLAIASAVWSPQAYVQAAEEESEKSQISEAVDEAYPKRELLLFEEIPTVISATKLEQPITESPSSISVITAEDIRRSGATNIADLLRRVPGLDVLRVTPSDAQISARGFNESNNNDMLLLIDGRSSYVDFFGIVVWDDLPIVLEEIERIEIIRGPGSALYGANAFSGVINLITKTPEQAMGTTLSATIGEFDTYIWTFMNADVMDRWSYKVVASWDEANSFVDRDENNHEMFKGNALVKYEFDPDSQIYFSAGVNEGDGNTLTRVSRFDRDGTFGYAKLNYDYGNWKFQTFYNLIDIDVLAADSEWRSIINNVFDFEMQHTLEPWEKHTITWGANYRHNRVTSHEIIGPDEQEDLFSLFIQDQYEILDDMTLTTGVRFDSHPLTGVHFSPRASLVYEPWESHIFRASVARAFRNPSFVESFLDLAIGPVTATGNRDLDAEEITSFELGYQTRLLENKLQFKLDTFYNILNEIIEYRNLNFPPWPPSLPPIFFDYENEGRAIAYGGEVSLEYHFSDRLSGYFNYSYQELKARSDRVQFQLNEDNETIDSSPRHKINAGIYGELENGLNGSVDLNFVDEVEVGFFDPSTTIPSEARLDDYTRVDARIGYKFPDRDLEVSLIVQNALNDSHQEFPAGVLDVGGEHFQRQVFFQVYGRF
ncbi:MAG: TonB-dependent receptor [Candidatus Abyssubacteria bacterium]|nr:TonB-dependent receptor [Candidatus Abyssubacteria bacterium]